MIRRPPRSTRTDTLFPYTTLFRSDITLELPPFSGFKIKFLYTVPVDDGDPGLLRVARVDEHALDHLIFSRRAGRRRGQGHPPQARDMQNDGRLALAIRRSGSSDERRVGNECVSTCSTGWSPYH